MPANIVENGMHMSVLFSAKPHLIPVLHTQTTRSRSSRRSRALELESSK